MGKHLVNGSPVYASLQAQIGLWFFTTHVANVPQDAGHGSTHFWLTHARSSGHSEFRVHSGRHIGGAPVNSGRQEQTPWPFSTRHWLFGPHGEGLHGSLYFISSSTRYFNSDFTLRKLFRLIFRNKNSWVEKIYYNDPNQTSERFFVPISRIKVQYWNGFPV